ncbi:hypothetical protein BDU57DRAFT_533186 [Ampelomyces quisqualis]|uniref:Aminoglycoside phosphotransferase domain-containing protein n=1 Tax=Ampelomyces quisqualis TaxID=50730 RepID=A0A6A5QAD4_AMPQU|nr:hypothetical protein BDU57DRAFT_533186 [Ampelomyces quisqualis]
MSLPPKMDINQPELLWTPEIARRTKAQVVLEEWKAPDVDTAFENKQEFQSRSPPANEIWTTLRSRPLSLYYQARSCPPIPFLNEIRNVTSNNRLEEKNSGHGVCKMGGTVIKFGCAANIVEEAENLLFLAEKRPELRIPTVLALWSTTEDEKIKDPVYCLMMEFIEGIPLNQETFMALPIHAQDTICAKVSSQLRYLRELPSEGYYGRVHGQGWLSPPPGLDFRSITSQAIVGPFRTYEEFVSAIYRSWQVRHAISYNMVEWTPADVEMTAKFMPIFPGWEPNEPKFTWIDPKLRNMIARQIKGDDGSEDWEVFLIDWEYCAWYPAWVQGLQTESCSGALIPNPASTNKYAAHIPYRGGEINSMMRKDFDPDFDMERRAIIVDRNWRFF